MDYFTPASFVFFIYKVGLNRIGLNRIGLNRIGLNKIGLNRIGLNKIGLNTRIGLNRIGLLCTSVCLATSISSYPIYKVGLILQPFKIVARLKCTNCRPWNKWKTRIGVALRVVV